jgi:hypothetical protein
MYQFIGSLFTSRRFTEQRKTLLKVIRQRELPDSINASQIYFVMNYDAPPAQWI